MLKRVFQIKKAKNNVSNFFMAIFLRLKEQNKEKWAARVIVRWWRKI